MFIKFCLKLDLLKFVNFDSGFIMIELLVGIVIVFLIIVFLFIFVVSVLDRDVREEVKVNIE